MNRRSFFASLVGLLLLPGRKPTAGEGERAATYARYKAHKRGIEERAAKRLYEGIYA